MPARLHYQPSNGGQVDLTELPIEELVDVEFVSVFKKPTWLFRSAAAAYAVTAEDLQRSGVTNIPDVLRMTPGMQVAQHNASNWSVTSRGFSGLSRGISGQFANKLLVLRDGRSVYTPLFSGVSWDTQDILLDDLERVEVIRGPGASLWGANAVNGVINMISKNSRATRGALLTLGLGTEQRSFGHLRYGGRLGDQSFYRVYAKFQNVDELLDSGGEKASDGWDVFRGGFRMDWNSFGVSRVTLIGDVYDGEAGQRYSVTNSLEPPFEEVFDFKSKIGGGNLLFAWKRDFSDGSGLTLQAYYDRVKRQEAVVNGVVDTYDLDFHHRFYMGERQEVIWGTGYRFIHDSFDSTFAFSLGPNSRDVAVINAFLQDEIALLPNELFLTLGSKFEHNGYTGFEFQPNVRLLWTPSHLHTVWGAASRAVRTPSRSEDDARIVLRAQTETAPTTFEMIFGNRDFESENLTAFEVGYRTRPREWFSLDIASFYNLYDNLRTNEPGSAFVETSPLRFIIPFTVANRMRGKTFGFELTTDWQMWRRFHFRTAYSFLKMQLTRNEDSRDTAADIIEGQSPNHQFFLSSFVELSDKLELNSQFRYVDSLPGQGVSSYVNMDVRVGWKALWNLEVSLVGRNLLHGRFAENSSILTLENTQLTSVTESSQVQRSVYTKFTWRF